MIWSRDMSDAPRDEFTQVLIAVQGSRDVKVCRWWRKGRQWSGLFASERPVAWCVVTHPDHFVTPVTLPFEIEPTVTPVTLPEGIEI